MAASATTPSACNGTAMSNHLSNFIPCQYTLVATKAEHGSSNDDDALEHTRRAPVPRVCRLRSRDNTMAIYAIADPIGPNMLAADVCANMLVEYLSKISFDDESYREEIEGVMQKISFEIENRLLQMTFDHAEEKVTSDPSSLDDTDKLLPSLEEAESGAFLCATAVTQSYVYIAYVGTIRAFLISNHSGVLSVADGRPQYYHDGSLHTIENDDECRRLKSLDVDVNQVRHEGLDKRNSRYTRCIGKLSEKLLSSAASANDVNEARCNPLVCEPKFEKFKILPQDYALVMMTDKVYQMYAEPGDSGNSMPTQFLALLHQSIDSVNPAQSILDTTEQKFQDRHCSSTGAPTFQEIGLLIHFFHNPMSNTHQHPLPSKLNSPRRPAEGEVTVEEVRKFIVKNNEMQQKRDWKTRGSAVNNRHQLERQSHKGSVKSFVKFDAYDTSMNEREDFRHANQFITELLYTQPVSVFEEQLKEYLREHPSLVEN